MVRRPMRLNVVAPIDGGSGGGGSRALSLLSVTELLLMTELHLVTVRN